MSVSEDLLCAFELLKVREQALYRDPLLGHQTDPLPRRVRLPTAA